MDFSLSHSAGTQANDELARVQHETALKAYTEQSGAIEWSRRVTADEFFQATAELRSLVQPETGGTFSLKEVCASALLALVVLALIWIPDWNFWGRGLVVDEPRAEVPALPLELLPVSLRQSAENFNKNCKGRQWTEAWKELTTICSSLPQNAGQEPRQALRERLYILGMNRATGDLDESSVTPLWQDLDKAEGRLFPYVNKRPKFSDEACVASFHVAYLRMVRPIINCGLGSGKPALNVTRKELNDLGNQVRELAQRENVLSKDSVSRLKVVDAAVHLALVWTMTTPEVGLPVVVRRDPKPKDDPETGRWWNRLHNLIYEIEKEPAIAGQNEWRLIRKGFWNTVDDFNSNPFSKETVHLGSHDYPEKDVEERLKAVE